MGFNHKAILSAEACNVLNHHFLPPVSYRPFQMGSRFSEKARAPSSWSSLE